jgi:flagellar biosynthesis/type III secretory pathway protein FliH
MRQLVMLVVVAFVAIGLSGCGGDPHEAAMRDMVSLLEEFNAELATVEDEASLEAALPKLKAITARAKDVQQRIEKMEDPSKEKEEALKKKYEERFDAVMKDLMKNGTKAGMVAAKAGKMKELEDAMGGLSDMK